ncbi:MAG: aldo/keto reductase [Balneolaceae bacterium]
MKKSDMEYRNTKRFDKRISKIGFGAWQLGNRKEYESMSEEIGIQLVHKAVQQGITFFDTAPNYGEGNSEKILGLALEGTEDEIFINTKVGHTHEGKSDFSLDGITESIHKSMDNLKRSKLDSVILHNPGRDILEGKEGHYEHLKTLKNEGLMDGYGVSIDTSDELKTVLDHSDVDVIELMFNLIHQSPKVWFDEIEKRGILLIIKVPLDSGWLTGKFNSESTFTGIRSRWSVQEIQQRAELVQEIKDIVEQDNLVPVALSFILSFEAVNTVIPGIRNEDQLHSNIDSMNFELTNDMKEKLENLYESKILSLNIPW